MTRADRDYRFAEIRRLLLCLRDGAIGVDPVPDPSEWRYIVDLALEQIPGMPRIAKAAQERERSGLRRS